MGSILLFEETLPLTTFMVYLLRFLGGAGVLPGGCHLWFALPCKGGGSQELAPTLKALGVPLSSRKRRKANLETYHGKTISVYQSLVQAGFQMELPALVGKGGSFRED